MMASSLLSLGSVVGATAASAHELSTAATSTSQTDSLTATAATGEVDDPLLPLSSSAEETLNLFTTLLGTFHLKKQQDDNNGDVVAEEDDDHEMGSALKQESSTLSPTSSTIPSRNGRLLQLVLARKGTATTAAAATTASLPNQDATHSSFSCLSLHHEHHHEQGINDDDSNKDHQHHHGMARDEAEELAATLLARPIYAVAQQQPSTDERTIQDGSAHTPLPIHQIPQVLLEHLQESFFCLVNARLRAHASFLIHHGQALLQQQSDPTTTATNDNHSIASMANLTRKLEMLLWLGNHIAVDAAVTSFFTATETASNNDNDDDDDEEDQDEEMLDEKGDAQNKDKGIKTPKTTATTTAALPIRLEGVLDLTIPHFHFGVRNTTVTICSSGTISGEFDVIPTNNDNSTRTSPNSSMSLRSVHVALDTHELLADIIDQASHVVSVIVDMTNDACKSAALVAALATAAATAPLTAAVTSPLDAVSSKLLFPNLSTITSTENSNKRMESTAHSDFALFHGQDQRTIVTPDLSGHSIGKRVPSFTLDGSNSHGDNNHHKESSEMATPIHSTSLTASTNMDDSTSSSSCPLTPERCANIVDFAICDIDDTILIPTKRRRLEQVV